MTVGVVGHNRWRVAGWQGGRRAQVPTPALVRGDEEEYCDVLAARGVVLVEAEGVVLLGSPWAARASWRRRWLGRCTRSRR